MPKAPEIDQLVARVRSEAWRSVLDVVQGATAGDTTAVGTRRVDELLADAERRSGRRTKFPDRLQRFPLTISKGAQQLILRLTDLLSFDQRFTDRLLVGAIREMMGALSQTQRAVRAELARVARTQRRHGRRLDAIEASLDALTAMVRQGLGDSQNVIDESSYSDFEREFRGSPELVKSRMGQYLEVIRSCGAGTSDYPVLDLGCGRGEWLELLQEAGLHARGIDLNQAFVEQCKGRGLAVSTADAVEHLSRVSEASLGAVTSFQLIEHLPFVDVLTIFDRTLRVLRPGGVAVFETPNPENVYVLATTFYMDPTHRKPLPAPMVQFFARRRGFDRVEIKYMNPRAIESADPGSRAEQFLARHYDGAQDYAVICYKKTSESASA